MKAILIALLLLVPAADAANTIPVEIFERLIFVPVRVNDGAPLTFILHTGAPHSYLDQRISSTTNTSCILTIGTTRIPDIRLQPLDLSSFEAGEGRHVDGVLGADLFSRFAVEIDWDSSVIRLHEASSFRYSGSGQTLPVVMKSGKPYIRAEVKLPGRAKEVREYLVDTGSADAIADDLLKTAHVPLLGPDLARFDAVRIGRFHFRGVNGTSGGPKVGGELLHRFHLIADFAHARLILETNRFYGDAFLFDTSGLDLESAPRGYRVARVFPGTPAAEAGLRGGDIIMSIDGSPVESLGLERVRLMFHQVRQYALTVERDRHTIDVQLRLRTLL
jgi:hypothetical protein